MTWKSLMLALVLTGSVACAAPGTASATPSHQCADKVAQLTVSGHVPGLWVCLSKDLQAAVDPQGKDWTLTPFASKWQYIGQGNDTGHEVSIYQLTYTVQVAQKYSQKGMLLIVYLDAGLVVNVGTPSPAF